MLKTGGCIARSLLYIAAQNRKWANARTKKERKHRPTKHELISIAASSVSLPVVWNCVWMKCYTGISAVSVYQCFRPTVNCKRTSTPFKDVGLDFKQGPKQFGNWRHRIDGGSDSLYRLFPWGDGDPCLRHVTQVSPQAAFHSNGFSRCSSVTDDIGLHTAGGQTDRPATILYNMCRNRRNRFQRCRLKIVKIWALTTTEVTLTLDLAA